MEKTKLRYTFHNPNTAETAAEYILRVLIMANRSKLDEAIKKEADHLKSDSPLTDAK